MKQKSSTSKNKTLFSIHLLQDEDGAISVVAEAAGAQPEAYEIGIEVMASLEAAAVSHPYMKMRVQPLVYSTSLH